MSTTPPSGSFPNNAELPAGSNIQLTPRSRTAKRSAEPMDEEPGDITAYTGASAQARVSFAGDAGLLGGFKDGDEMSAAESDRDPSTAVVEKLIYFTRQQLTDFDLHVLFKNQQARSWEARLKKMLEKNHQYRWQWRILTSWLLPFVEKKYLKAKSDGQNLLEMSKDERAAFWRECWVDGPPARLCMEMWQPVSSVVDFAAIIDPPTGSTEADRAILKAWKNFLFNVFKVTADLTLNYRVRVRNVTLGEMTAYDDTVDTVTKADEVVFGQWLRLSYDIPHPGIEEVPVLVSKAASKRVSKPPAKKPKMLSITDAP
ncbi:hypothetical protein DBV05_g11372 [Lasiodiplodia theobromae]|uniref:Uncharacterized protein n=1 Tax=Lasiodiplodia theobromae TaxID=45133 RepID=A0A5N5CX47_9PEZI|nr:hypothetical protein DBV05_g11372 [Lasiodiplodia theobromae]